MRPNAHHNVDKHCSLVCWYPVMPIINSSIVLGSYESDQMQAQADVHHTAILFKEVLG